MAGSWIERLHRQMQHDGGILAHRIKHHRIGEGRSNLAKDMNCFCFQTLKMCQVLLRDA